jgi:hypothetical protein
MTLREGELRIGTNSSWVLALGCREINPRADSQEPTARSDHESSFISQENLYEVQNRPAAGRDSHHLREPET